MNGSGRAWTEGEGRDVGDEFAPFHVAALRRDSTVAGCGCYGGVSASPVAAGKEDGGTRGEVRTRGKMPRARMEAAAAAAAGAPAAGAPWDAIPSPSALVQVSFFSIL